MPWIAHTPKAYFLGVDLAWGQNKPTGLCLADPRGRVLGSTRRLTDTEIIEWMAPYCAGNVVVAFDAPLVVTNSTGQRRCETLISKLFGAVGAGAHSSNCSQRAFRNGAGAWRLTERLGLALDLDHTPGGLGRFVIEVYPHPTLVELFHLNHALAYKGRARRSVETRRAAFERLFELLARLDSFDPPLDVTGSPRGRGLRTEFESAWTSAALKRVEDELDAYICAYVASYFWHHGSGERCRVVGTPGDGFIVTPMGKARQVRLDSLR